MNHFYSPPEKNSFPTAAYINNLNTLFEPSHSPAHSIQQLPIPSSLPPQSLPLPPPPSSLSPSPPNTFFSPEPTYEFRPPNFYPNLYTDPLHQPLPAYPPLAFIEQQKPPQNQTHKWWSFHSIKEKVKSLFKFKNSKDELQNPIHTPDNQQQLWPGKFLTKFKWKQKSIGIDFNFGVDFVCSQIIVFEVCIRFRSYFYSRLIFKKNILLLKNIHLKYLIVRLRTVRAGLRLWHEL